MPNIQVERLKQLPQHPKETWQGGFVRLPAWVMEEPQCPYRAIASIWTSLSTQTVGLGKNPCRKEEVTLVKGLDDLVMFATDEMGYRPGALQVNDQALAEYLTENLSEAGIQVEYSERLLLVDRQMESMMEFMTKGRPLPQGYLKGKGVTLQHVKAFSEAAALFYQASPWEELSNEDLLQIESPQTPEGMQYAVVLGHGGMEFGLGFYKNEEDYWASRNDDYVMSSHGLWSLLFNDITEIPFADADLWEDCSLPVGGQNAYPMAAHYMQNYRIHRPNAETLIWLEGLLRTLALTTEEEFDSGQWTKRVITFNGERDYCMSLPFLLNPPSHEDNYKHGLADTRAMESIHTQVDRFLADKEFADIDEINRAVEKEFSGKPIDATHAPRTPAEEAQDLCYEAFDAIGRMRVKLAKQALDIFPDCVDAYVLLAENATTPEKAAAFFAQGVQAGRRVLGEAFFQENQGHFWGVLQTRPFMRCLEGLAVAAMAMGQELQSIDHMKELLRLNPGDNQGVRYRLMPLLIANDKLKEAEVLWEEYDEGEMTFWAYNRVVLSFAQCGPTAKTKKELQVALGANPYVPAYLLGEKEFYDLPPSYHFGSEEEAVIYVTEASLAWDSTSGVLEWLDHLGRR